MRPNQSTHKRNFLEKKKNKKKKKKKKRVFFFSISHPIKELDPPSKENFQSIQEIFERMKEMKETQLTLVEKEKEKRSNGRG